MKKSNHSNVTYVTTGVLTSLSLKKNIESVHEERNCNICDYSCSLKMITNGALESVHSGIVFSGIYRFKNP